MKILLVEDDLSSAQVASDILRHKGHEVHAVHTGADALREAEQGDYRAAVIDVVLPDTDGFSLAPHLMEVQPQMECVLVTGHFLPDGAERAQTLRAHFRNKPLDFEELERLLVSAAKV